MWPDWLKSVVPRVDNEHTQFLTKVDLSRPGYAVVMPDLQFKRGPAGARKIRKVCDKCNSGWMSNLETAAKPTLTEMICGKILSLDVTSQTAISAWAMMTSIIAEYTDIPTQSIPASDRQHLMAHKIPTDAWRVWIGKYAGDNWKQRYRHHGIAVGLDYGFRIIQFGHNTQTSTFVVGDLLIHATSSTLLKLESPFEANMHDALVQVWPTSSSTITWPPSRTLNDTDATQISDALFRRILSTSANSAAEET
jgi:hypothetical protein